jgi:carbon-monoxide dehydrogenase medium subunit
MFPAAFDYVAPSSLQDALKELSSSGGDAKVLAGGHSLLPLMKLRLARPSKLVDLGKIKGLSYVKQDGGNTAIGAMTTHADVIKANVPLLSETAAHVGDIQVRNRGTLGGSLAHADPAGDLPAAVLALGAEIAASGPQGQRTIKADDFFVDLLTTALADNEILTEVRIPALKGKTGFSYKKFAQPASRYAICGVAAVVTLGADDTIESARVAITGVGVKAYRATGVEQALQGKTANAENLQAASQKAADGVDAAGDIHASTEYRAHLARVYTRRALEEAVSRAKGGK